LLLFLCWTRRHETRRRAYAIVPRAPVAAQGAALMPLGGVLIVAEVVLYWLLLQRDGLDAAPAAAVA
jgi:hypothetical protein